MKIACFLSVVHLLFIYISFSIYISLFSILFLLLVSALVSGSEIAFFSLTPQQLEDCKQSKASKDRYILYLLANPQKLLATILIVNNLVNIAIIMLSTFSVWQFTESAREGWGIVILTIFITITIVFFGEITPKVLATHKNLSFARFTVRILVLFSWLIQPFSFLLVQLDNLLVRNKKKYNISIKELNKAIEMAANQSSKQEKEILKGVANFGIKTVKQIMCSRIDIISFEIKEGFIEILEKINQTTYSRIPIYDHTIDSIKGILYIKDLLPFLREDSNFDWTTLIKKNVFFVPEYKKIDELLKDFQAKCIHIAIVVDEYGGTSGLITMEDIIEEIVGEINDEFDEEEVKFKQIDQQTFFFEGKTSLNDFSKILGIDPGIFNSVKGENESIGGLLLELFAKIPSKGEQISFQNFIFIVINSDAKKIKSVKVLVTSIE